MESEKKGKGGEEVFSRYRKHLYEGRSEGKGGDLWWITTNVGLGKGKGRVRERQCVHMRGAEVCSDRK